MTVYLVWETGGLGWGEDNYTTLHIIARSRKIAEEALKEAKRKSELDETKEIYNPHFEIEERELDKILN